MCAVADGGSVTGDPKTVTCPGGAGMGESMPVKEVGQRHLIPIVRVSAADPG